MDGVSLGRWEDSLSLGSPAECCWIIAEIDVTDDEGRSEVVTVRCVMGSVSPEAPQVLLYAVVRLPSESGSVPPCETDTFRPGAS